VPQDTHIDSAGDRLDSWKAIAAYLGRDVTTVQRWEKREGLPVHRHLHDKLGTVYAFKPEIDTWWHTRRAGLEGDGSVGTRGKRLVPRWTGRRTTITAALVLLIVVAAAAWGISRRPLPSPTVVARSLIPLPAGASSAYSIAVSHDGAHLVYVGLAGPMTTSHLYLKAMNELSSVALPGTEGAMGPFFSPDGNWVGFFARGKLKKVAVTGGAPVVICDAPAGTGGTWGRDGTLVFASAALTGLSRVPASGGTPVPITTPDRARFERSHRDPRFLPDGRAVLFTVHRATHDSFDDADIEIANVETGERSLVVQGGMAGLLTASGHLVYGRHASLWAAPFDARRRAVGGPAMKVIEGVLSLPSSGRVA
jgi:hypothetical protein